MIPRNNGIDVDNVAQTEADHFSNCPVCGAYLDMRDLSQVLAHVHGAEIEILEGPELPFSSRQFSKSPYAEQLLVDLAVFQIYIGSTFWPIM